MSAPSAGAITPGGHRLGRNDTYFPSPALPEQFAKEEWLALLAYTGLGIAGALACLVIFICICLTARSCARRHLARRAASQATPSIQGDWPVDHQTEQQPSHIKLLVREAVVVLQPGHYLRLQAEEEQGETWLGVCPSISDPCEIPPHLEALMQQEAEPAMEQRQVQENHAQPAITVNLHVIDAPVAQQPGEAAGTVELTLMTSHAPVADTKDDQRHAGTQGEGQPGRVGHSSLTTVSAAPNVPEQGLAQPPAGGGEVEACSQGLQPGEAARGVRVSDPARTPDSHPAPGTDAACILIIQPEAPATPPQQPHDGR